MEEDKLDVEKELDLADEKATQDNIRYTFEEVFTRVKEKLKEK